MGINVEPNVMFYVQMILHSLTHIESVAVDLAWDAIARFGIAGRGYQLPRAFFDDFVGVAEDEARHFRLLAERLKVRRRGTCMHVHNSPVLSRHPDVC